MRNNLCHNSYMTSIFADNSDVPSCLTSSQTNATPCFAKLTGPAIFSFFSSAFPSSLSAAASVSLALRYSNASKAQDWGYLNEDGELGLAYQGLKQVARLCFNFL